MSRELNPSQIWSQVPVASRTVTVTTNSDKTGYTATVSDKTGFSLTAGSYSVRASSFQRGDIAISGSTTGTASISSVTLARAHETYNGEYGNGNTAFGVSSQLTATTTMTATIILSGTISTKFTVSEFF